MNLRSTISFSLSLFALLALSAHAEEQRIYQTDSLGNLQYNKPSLVIQKDGRVIETDPIGNKQYQKQQYQIKGDKVYQSDSVGNIQYHEPHRQIK
jgi:hypothetical protein